MLSKLIKIIVTLIFLLLLILIIWLLFLKEDSPENYVPSPPQLFTITFDDNGGQLENAFPITNVEPGVYILEIVYNHDISGTKDNHTLYGWRLNSADGIRVSSTQTMPYEDVILFANWLMNDEEPLPPPLLPDEFRIINDTIFNGVDILSFVAILEYDKVITIIEEVSVTDYVMRLILDNLTEDAINYHTTINDLQYWFLIIVNVNNIYIRNNMTDIPFVPL